MPSPTVSERQLAANRANALRSTGPVSNAGKAKSSQNARKHGVFSEDVVLPHEDREAFECMRKDMIRTLNPANFVELALVEQIVANEWRIKRVRSNEAKLAAAGNPEDQKQLERFQSYEMRLRGSVFRCMRELRTLRNGEVSNQTDLTQTVLSDETSIEEVRNEPNSTPTAWPASGYEAKRSLDPHDASKPTPRERLAMAVNETIHCLDSPPIIRKAG